MLSVATTTQTITVPPTVCVALWRQTPSFLLTPCYLAWSIECVQCTLSPVVEDTGHEGKESWY
jgi:hypothetical protein